MNPFFSCVVAVKGPRPYLDAALASLAGQDFGDDLEVIVQDGDAEPDAGLSDAFNTGFAKVRGAWLPLLWRAARRTKSVGARLVRGGCS